MFAVFRELEKYKMGAFTKIKEFCSLTFEKRFEMETVGLLF